MYKSRYEFWTIADLEINRENIDCNPIHQRLARGATKDNHAKSISIIESILKGIGIGLITVHETPDGEFDYESIDGGHRKRAILGYLNGEFKANGKLFRELSEKERNEFRATIIPFHIYENLTGPEVGYLFRTLNQSTPVTHQETLNSYGDTPIANAIRGVVRDVPGQLSTPHPFFSFSTKKSKAGVKSIIYDFIDKKFTNEGLAQEEWVARLFYLYSSGGKITQCTDKHLEELYDSNPSQAVVDGLQTKINDLLKFVQKMSNYRNTLVTGNKSTKKMSIMEANLFVRLYFYMTEKYGKFKFSTADGKTDSDFYDAVWKAHTLLSDKKTTDPELLAVSPFDGRKMVGGQYCSSLTEYKYKKEVIMFPVELLLKRVDIKQFLIIKDKRRAFSAAEREVALAKQDRMCPETGRVINLSTAEGDHVIPHARGGRTVPENLSMVVTAYNKDKSDKVTA